jgi:hypothetical protein
MAAAGLIRAGVVPWGRTVPEPGPGVYVVALTQQADSRRGCLSKCPLSRKALEEWLEVRPELRLDRRRPTAARLADRIASFWLPDEVIVYIGLAGSSLQSRVRQYYETPLGARRPHAGGHFLKTLANIDDLYVHWAPAADPREAEDVMLGEFCRAVSESTRTQLPDPEHPFPFGNLEWPAGTRKRHGLTRTKGEVRPGRAPLVRSHSARRKAESSGGALESTITLHEEISRILAEHGLPCMTTEELAAAVNEAGNYVKKDGSDVTAFQIHGRTRNYPALFERDGSRVRLRR